MNSPARETTVNVAVVQAGSAPFDTEACVVAVQYNGGRTAVAARFTGEVANWIVKPEV